MPGLRRARPGPPRTSWPLSNGARGPRGRRGRRPRTWTASRISPAGATGSRAWESWVCTSTSRRLSHRGRVVLYARCHACQSVARLIVGRAYRMSTRWGDSLSHPGAGRGGLVRLVPWTIRAAVVRAARAAKDQAERHGGDRRPRARGRPAVPTPDEARSPEPRRHRDPRSIGIEHRGVRLLFCCDSPASPAQRHRGYEPPRR